MIYDLMLPQPMILESQDASSDLDGATIERRTRINRPDDANGRCRVSRAWDPRKDFSRFMLQPTIPSTSSVISPQQERIEPSGPRRCRRGAKSSLRREPNMPTDLLRALFGNVTVPLHALLEQQHLPRGSLSKLVERFACLFQNRGLAGFGLITAEDDVDIKWIELDATATSASSLGGNQGRARPEER